MHPDQASYDDTTRAAATLFRAAITATSDPDTGARLWCLAALHHLGNPTIAENPAVSTATAEALIQAALQTLATLPLQQFASPPVLQASAAGRRALRQLS